MQSKRMICELPSSAPGTQKPYFLGFLMLSWCSDYTFAVLFSIKAYERVSKVIEAIENSDEESAIRALEEIIRNREMNLRPE